MSFCESLFLGKTSQSHGTLFLENVSCLSGLTNIVVVTTLKTFWWNVQPPIYGGSLTSSNVSWDTFLELSRERVVRARARALMSIVMELITLSDSTTAQKSKNTRMLGALIVQECLDQF